MSPTAGQESGRLRRAHAHLLGIHHVGDTRSPVRLRREVPREEEEHLGQGGVRLAPQGLGEGVEGKEVHLCGAAAHGGGRPEVQLEGLAGTGQRELEGQGRAAREAAHDTPRLEEVHRRSASQSWIAPYEVRRT